MGQYSAAMLEVVQRNPKSLFLLLDIQLPSGTRRYATDPIKSSTGQYQGRIVSMGRMYRACSDVDGRLIYPRLDAISVADHTQELARELELTEPGGSPILLRLCSELVDEADWFTLAGNFLLDMWEQQRPHVWTFSFSYNDFPLRSLVPRTPILRPDFPNVVDPILYTYHVLLGYGIHSSEGIGDKGMIEPLYVDTTLGWFGPWLGWIPAIPRVFKNELLQTLTTDYTVIRPIINGRQYTLVDFVIPPDPEDTVTVDLEGYNDGTDGAGSILTGPHALEHFLATFVYPEEDWKRGAWPDPADAPISLDHFDEIQSFLAGKGWEKVSRSIGGRTRLKAEDHVKGFTDSFGKIGLIGSFITRDGKIALRPNNPFTEGLFYEGPLWVAYDRDQLGDDNSFSQPMDRHTLVDRLTIEFLLNSVDDAYRWSLEVSDLSVGRNSATNLRMPWSHAGLE